MKYQLISPRDKSLSPLEQVLFNRGIPLNNLENFIYLSENGIENPLLLKNMAEGVAMLIKHIEKNDKIFIQVD